VNWLLLRGLGREQRHWGRFPAVLRRELAGESVHFLDLPGAGTEHARKSPARIAAITIDLRYRFLELQARSPGPWRLLGLSLGGMVAMDWCERFPGDFGAVVLVNTSAADLSRPWRRMQLDVVPGFVAALASRDEVARGRRILRMTARLVTDPEPIAREWARIQEAAPVSRANVLRQLCAASRFQAPHKLHVPALVIAAARDPLCDPACARRLASRFGAPLLTHPQAGHDLPLDDPEWLAGQIRSWVQSAARVAPAA
jgi:pimeloyl-ACP methyl ester carboxylesterase